MPTDIPFYLDHTQPIDTRVDDLISRLTLDEKIGQMIHNAPAIERLDIPAYNWWNECLHGVARAGLATVFPQAIGLAAMWNEPFLHQIATAISDEARAKHHDAVARGVRDIYFGLTFWTPNINIFRDPRWGRGQETYGEDPYLTSRLGVAFVRGLQGNDERYLKLVATPKHFAVHSGPEHLRHEFDAHADERDLRLTYLPAFEACIREGKALSVMGAYNRTNGEPCCASPSLLQKILRDEWGFEGYVVSDCWAISDIYKHHQVVESAAEAAALAVNSGCELNCGDTYPALKEAVETGLISEATIDEAVKRLFRARFRLGMFDPPEEVAYTRLPMTVVDSAEHRQMALEAARQSIVLLKNENNLLPLDRDAYSRIAVIGPNAYDSDVLLGNYNGTPSYSVTPLAGIRAKVMNQVEVVYARGCPVAGEDRSGYGEALAVAEKADLVIFVGGLSQWLEGEEGQHESVPEGQQSQGDRAEIELPPVQEELLKQLAALGQPLVLVLLNGGALAMPWSDENIPAIIEAWYPGEESGTALADVLFGDYNPAGRLPVTFYRSTDDLPPFEDYAMQNRTYRYFEDEVLYPFGHGLSYSTFAYANLRLNADTITPDDSLHVEVEVQNTGQRAGDEVVQLYISDVDASVPVPIRQLHGFVRIHLSPGEKQTVAFDVAADALAIIDEDGQRVVEAGEFLLSVGGRQPMTNEEDSSAIRFASLRVR
jgi:beta-glucosidase